MPHDDMVVADAPGATVRSKINSGFQALASTSKGNTDPATPYAGQHSIRDDSPSSSVWTEQVYDGTNQIPVARIDSTNNRNIPYNGPHGQSRLTKSGSNLLLSPLNGNVLIINGAPEAIPAAGVTLSPSGLSSSTTYFIYAYMNSGTMTLEASATGHVTDTTTGVETKSGDASRTLVGMGRTNGSAAWVDTAAQRFVISWFNRRAIHGSASFSTTRSTTSGTNVELNSEIRNEFLTWADEAVVAAASGGVIVGTADQNGTTAIGYDGTTAEPGQSIATANATTRIMPFAVTAPKSLSEGYHYATLLGNTGSEATGTWQAVSTVSTVIRG